jgi:hypothetical protein
MGGRRNTRAPPYVRGVFAALCLALTIAAPANGQSALCPPLFADEFEDGSSPSPPDPQARCSDVPVASIGMMGVTFVPAPGDLDVSLRRADGTCIAGRLDDNCAWSNRNWETGDEILSVLNWSSAPRRQDWRVEPFNGMNVASVRFDTALAYADAPVCTSLYGADLCEGRPGGVPSLLQFPRHDATDPFIGDGLRLQMPANYRWVRLELLMLVRHALRQTQLRFQDTRPLGVGDICQRDTITPGFDIGAPRHPATSHDQGGNIDLAYFNTLAAQGTIPFSQVRIVCDANGASNDGFFCNPGAASTHVVDLPRQVYFMAQLFASPRLRVIGVDQVIGPLLRAEADAQLAAGAITQAQRDAFYNKLGFGQGWEFTFAFIHVSLLYWTP